MGPETRALNVPIASPSWPVYGQIVRERKIKRSTHAHVSTCSVSPVEPVVTGACPRAFLLEFFTDDPRSALLQILASSNHRACNQTHVDTNIFPARFSPPPSPDTFTLLMSNEDGLYFSSPRRKIRTRSYCIFFLLYTRKVL